MVALFGDEMWLSPVLPCASLVFECSRLSNARASRLMSHTALIQSALTGLTSSYSLDRGNADKIQAQGGPRCVIGG